MQFQNTPHFIIKSFKRHFYKVKEVAELLAKSDGSLKFQYTYEKGTLQTRIETPNDEATIRLFNLETTPVLEPTKERLEEMNFISFPLCTEEE